MSLPLISRAPEGQTPAQAPQERQEALSSAATPSSMRIAPKGQTFSQAPHPVHSSRKNRSSGEKLWDSGLLHQRQRSGQPFRNTVVLMPGPSLVDMR